MKCRSQPVSRILSAFALDPAVSGYSEMTIPLAPALLTGSSNLPGSSERAAQPAPRRGEHARGCCFPIWSCSVRGFACHICCQMRGALLPHLFTLARLRRAVCFLCHWSVGSPRPGVTRRTALWSSDFPLPRHFVRSCRSRGRRNGYTRQRSSGQLQQLILRKFLGPDKFRTGSCGFVGSGHTRV